MASGRGNYTRGISYVLLADLLWGTVFFASQIGLTYIGPYSLLFLRFGVASAVIIAAMPLMEKRLRILPELRKGWVWIFGLLYTLGFVLQYVGQDMTTASEATLLANLSPIIIPIFAYAVLKEKVGTFQKLAIAMGLAGLLLVASPRLSVGLNEATGNLLLFLTSVFYALFTVLNKRVPVGALSGSLAIILIVTTISLPIVVVMGGFDAAIISMPPVGWGAVMFLGIVCTLVALTCYLKGLSIVPASQAGILFLVQILVGLLLSTMVLGETMSPGQTAGAALTVAALFIGILRR